MRRFADVDRWWTLLAVVILVALAIGLVLGSPPARETSF
jgi:cytochrome c-type biogenesis protein CcmE